MVTSSLDKMLVDNIGDVTITNDGATILSLLEVTHPAVRDSVSTNKSASLITIRPEYWSPWLHSKTRRLVMGRLRWCCSLPSY